MTSDLPPTGPAAAPTPPPRTPGDQPPAPPPRRRSGMRIVGWIVLALVLLLAIGLLVLYFNLNRIVRTTVERQSTAQLNTQTSLQSANVSLFGGEVSLNNFQVTSPQGFAAPHLMTLGGIDVGVRVRELRQDPLRVNRITINQPRMVIEMQGREFNVRRFIDNLPTEDRAPEDEEPIRLIINDLRVQGAQVVFRPDVQALAALPGIGETLKGMRQEYVLNIPNVQLENVGTGEGAENGAAIKDVVTLLVTELAARAAESEDLPPELRNLLNLNVTEMTELAKQKIGQELNRRLDEIGGELSKRLPPEASQALQGVLKDPAAAAKDPGKAIEAGLGGLLGRDRATQPTTQPATQPAPGDEPRDAIQRGLGGLLDRTRPAPATQPR